MSVGACGPFEAVDVEVAESAFDTLAAECEALRFENRLLKLEVRTLLRTTVEFQALEYPLPDAAREKLAKLGKAACDAREKAGHSAIVTKEGSALAEFEEGLRTTIGVLHRREWLGSRAL